MQKYLIFVLALATVACSANEVKPEQKIYPIAKQVVTEANPANFTGKVYTRGVWSAKAPMQANGAFVIFTPGSRTYWHEHPTGQSFIVTEGEGYVQEEGKPKVVLHAGDGVVCPPGVKHWHGGSKDKMMIQFAISEKVPGKQTAIWHEPVSDEQYNSH